MKKLLQVAVKLYVALMLQLVRCNTIHSYRTMPSEFTLTATAAWHIEHELLHEL
jgi:hypothetical protein